MSTIMRSRTSLSSTCCVRAPFGAACQGSEDAPRTGCMFQAVPMLKLRVS